MCGHGGVRQPIHQAVRQEWTAGDVAGWHSAWSLATTFTASPCQSVPSAIASQRLTPEADCPVSGLVAFEDRNLLLHFDGATHRSADAVEHNEEGITASLDDPATMPLYRRIDHVAAERAQAFERPNVVQTDQTTVADHVGVHDCDQLPPI